MKLTTLATGSKGNCYLLSTETETLFLDCGIPIKEIKKGLDFDLSKIVGCVVSHGHSDHDKSANDLKKMGIKVFKPYLDENKMQTKCFGGFMVRSFEVPHDNEPCCGFLIECPNGEKLLYATDFEYIKYSFKKMKIKHLLVECNYQKEYVNNSAENRSHVLRGHAELQTTIGIVKDNADSLKNVILCHLSNANANPKECVAEVQKVARNAKVDYARKGFEIELKDNNCPF